MTSKPTTILERAEAYVTAYFKNEMPNDLIFHNLSHTLEVVEASQILGEKAALLEEEQEIFTLAAWFHDTGYAESYEGHEEKSRCLAEKYLTEEDYPEEKRKKVLDLIHNTENTASEKLHELMHDADLSNLGRKRFFRKGELIRAELERYQDFKTDELTWEKRQYDFLRNNPFKTRAALDEYGTRYNKNLKKQRENILKARKVTNRTKTGKNFGRGIDTLYRANYRTHINLSAIADGKANMMISINTIMISVIVTLSGASFSVNQNFTLESLRFTVPILIMLIGAMISLIFAVMSARPKVTNKVIDKEEVKNDKMSLLYFGNFLGIPKEEFVDYLNKLKMNQERVYDSMSIDIYNLGLVLRKKYQLLTIAYNTFMIGLTLTVLAFLCIFIYTSFLS